ncbi:MAG TPA: FAD-linked oxidase C-terminal domain-containing protein [Gemmataceae bacterium]|jgi:FAD/FMN-containing dehydrogenase/Fe-S oxidoreductase|nr:FAD-linked oxidase C-terminal domain-containing protein [Gemmataceae bacterium]
MPLDPAQRERLREDLRGLVRGELLFDDLSRNLYSTDASIFRVEPLGVVAPCVEEDVQALVRYAGEQGIPLIARGAGTGLAGEALGGGIVLDLSQHFRQILEIGADTVRVQPGVVLNTLNSKLAEVGRRFAPDPASAATCTIGGMLATDASGSRLLKFGYTRDHVQSCRIVLDNGEAVAAGCERLDATPEPTSRFGKILQDTAKLLHEHRDSIRSAQPRTPYNRCGYHLTDVLEDGVLNLPRLLVGSEGTLALFTEATLKTIPLPGGRSVVMFGFAGLDLALKAVPLALAHGPVSCDLLDRRLVSLARMSSAETAPLLTDATEAVLLLQFEADHPTEARLRANQVIEQIHRKESLSVRAQAAWETHGMEQLWSLRDHALPSLYSLGYGPRPIALIEDIGVPPDSLGVFLTRAQEILQKQEITASFLVHAGTGQIHMRPFVDLRNPADQAKLFGLAEAVFTLTLEMGGTVSTQHGTGLARTPWVARQYGPLFSVFRELKAIFDPKNIFNPDKIVAAEPHHVWWPLREPAAGTTPTPPAAPSEVNGAPVPAKSEGPFLVWCAEEIQQQVAACNGCGDCRVEAPPRRMCPMFRVTHAEAATPRAKASLLRQVLADPDPKRLGADDVREVADLCINCKMCAAECPAHVNIPKLMLEAKAAHCAEHGLDRTDMILARTEGFAAIGSRFSLLVNPLLESRAGRWLLERMFGISRHRLLPHFAYRSFMRIAANRGWTRKTGVRSQESGARSQESGVRSQWSGSEEKQLDGSPRSKLTPDSRLRTTAKVAYFVDVYANYNDPSIGEATVSVLRHNGVDVFVPPGQRACGMAALSHGDVEAAREIAQQNLRVFGDLAREGYRILCSEPTAALMLKQDYLNILDDPDARLVSEQTVELTAFLEELCDQRRFKTDFDPLNISVGYHIPCHLKALGQPPAGPRLLALIPQLRVHTIDVSCSGMAGTFGLNRRNYFDSLEAGRPMLEELRRPRILFGASECSACRMQMQEGSLKRALHPVQYLALAYGLMPELAQTLRTPLSRRKYLL